MHSKYYLDKNIDSFPSNNCVNDTKELHKEIWVWLLGFSLIQNIKPSNWSLVPLTPRLCLLFCLILRMLTPKIGMLNPSELYKVQQYWVLSFLRGGKIALPESLIQKPRRIGGETQILYIIMNGLTCGTIFSNNKSQCLIYSWSVCKL